MDREIKIYIVLAVVVLITLGMILTFSEPSKQTTAQNSTSSAQTAERAAQLYAEMQQQRQQLELQQKRLRSAENFKALWDMKVENAEVMSLGTVKYPRVHIFANGDILHVGLNVTTVEDGIKDICEASQGGFDQTVFSVVVFSANVGDLRIPLPVQCT